MTNTQLPEPLTASLQQAAAICNVSVYTLRRAIEAGDLKAIRPGQGKTRSKIFIRIAALYTWLDKLEEEG